MQKQVNDASVLGAGTHFEGDLSASGELILEGRVTGDGQVDGNLTLARHAHWRGNVRVTNAVISGQIHGDLYASGQVELAPTARITGNLVSPRVCIRPGAVVNGWVATSDTPPVGLLDGDGDEQTVAVGQPATRQVVGE